MDSVQKYVEVAVGSVANRHIIVPANDVHNFLQAEKELYVSYFSYNEEILEHMKVYKTVRSYKGMHYLRHIIFDIDKKNLKDEAMLDTVRWFINDNLKDEWGLENEHIQPFFSGRGFHLHCTDFFGFEPSKKLPSVVKATLNEYFDLPDDIYNPNRLIRVGSSFNMKSGLYKCPFTIDEVMSLTIDEIKMIAKTPREDFNDYASLPKFDKCFTKEIITPVKDLTRERSVIKDDPTGVVTCVQKIFNEGPVQGSRHLKMLRMISSFRRHGVPREGIYDIMSSWASEFEPYEVKRTVDGVFKHGYRYGCNDEIMNKYCDQKCVFYKRKDYTLDLKSSKQLEESFVNYIREDLTKKSFNIKNIWTSASSDWIVSPGQFVLIYGDTGAGKSSWVQNLVYESGLKTIFLSLEVDEYTTYRRFVQLAHEMTKEESISYYQYNDNGLSNKLSNIRVLTIAPTLKAVEQLVAQETPEILVVDTTDEILIDGVRGEIERQNHVALVLKELAQRHKMIVIGVHHLSKESSKRPMDIGVHSGKGSSSFPQKADKVIAINGIAGERRRVVKSVKSRDEQNFHIALDFHYETYRFKEAL